jgi:hypothetical protein
VEAKTNTLAISKFKNGYIAYCKKKDGDRKAAQPIRSTKWLNMAQRNQNIDVTFVIVQNTTQVI